MGDFEIVIPSCDPQMAHKAQSALQPLESRVFSGVGYNSFSKLVNQCILSVSKEIVIICNDRARATKDDVDAMLDLIVEGHGLVGLYRFGFFGFKKDLIRKIGFFDERFVGGGREDSDFIRRLKEADISYIGRETIKYVRFPSRWKLHDHKQHFDKKWHKDEKGAIARALPEENYPYDIGEYQGASFLPWKRSELPPATKRMSAGVITGSSVP